MRGSFPTIRERSYDSGEGKARTNPIALNWSWRYQYSFIDYNTYIDGCMLVHACSVTQLCLTLYDLCMGCSPQAPLSMGFSRQEYWSGSPLPSPGDLPDHRDK